MMPGGNSLVGLLFFLSLFTIGVDSAFFLAQGGVIAPLTDKFGWNNIKNHAGRLYSRFPARPAVLHTGRLYWLDIVDRSVSFYGLLITGILATVVVGWKFGR